jgi:hypothetical protein
VALSTYLSQLVLRALELATSATELGEQGLGRAYYMGYRVALPAAANELCDSVTPSHRVLQNVENGPSSTNDRTRFG